MPDALSLREARERERLLLAVIAQSEWEVEHRVGVISRESSGPVNPRCDAAWRTGAVLGWRRHWTSVAPSFSGYQDSSYDFRLSYLYGLEAGKELAERFEYAGGKWWGSRSEIESWGRDPSSVLDAIEEEG